jgi:hypothetical protein
MKNIGKHPTTMKEMKITMNPKITQQSSTKTSTYQNINVT